MTEIVAGEGAIVESLQAANRIGIDAFHISRIQVAPGRGSVVHLATCVVRRALARTEINAVLERRRVHAERPLLSRRRSMWTTRTTIDHAKPHGTSHELYKGILDGQSSAVFNGKIIVRKDAQKTDAKQTNKNLVLSENAAINTKPQLEIFADDVRCTHGATVGQLDQEAIFYLRNRAASSWRHARNMLIYAFAQEIIDRIKIAALRGQALQRLRRKTVYDYRRQCRRSMSPPCARIFRSCIRRSTAIRWCISTTPPAARNRAR